MPHLFRRENDSTFERNQIYGGKIVKLWEAFRKQREWLDEEEEVVCNVRVKNLS